MYQISFTCPGGRFAPIKTTACRSRSHRDAREASLFGIKVSSQLRAMERHWGGCSRARASAVWHRWASGTSATHERTARLSFGSTLTRTSMLGVARELDGVRTSYPAPASACDFAARIEPTRSSSSVRMRVWILLCAWEMFFAYNIPLYSTDIRTHIHELIYPPINHIKKINILKQTNPRIHTARQEETKKTNKHINAPTDTNTHT